MKIQPPRGMRDFTPEVLKKRYYVMDVLKRHFNGYGFLPIETPAIELLSTLTGKYGDEGDQLIYKILNSRLNEQTNKPEINTSFQNHLNAGLNSTLLTEKALRYDLTVPLARFVATHRHALAFPFRRYQIQPVWRADRPQKGRYREFWQCDVDVIGARSLMNETELIQLADAVFETLQLPVTLFINHRSILNGMADAFKISDQAEKFMGLLDKLDKQSFQDLRNDFAALGLSAEALEQLEQLLLLKSPKEKLPFQNPLLEQGLQELITVMDRVSPRWITLQWSPLLARGLSYYTGCIVEAKVRSGSLQSSILGGGRYDQLGSLFGYTDLSGVGISFGIDRICDVLEELNLFPASVQSASFSKILFTHFSAEHQWYTLNLARQCRGAGIACEVYAESGKKIGKQFDYAQSLGIPWVCTVGDNEVSSGLLSVKSMQSGHQEKMTFEQLIDKLNL